MLGDVSAGHYEFSLLACLIAYWLAGLLAGLLACCLVCRSPFFDHHARTFSSGPRRLAGKPGCRRVHRCPGYGSLLV